MMPKQQNNMTDAQDALKEIRERMLANGRFASDQKTRQRADQTRRDNAEKAAKPVFLRPNDLSGDYDFDRALMTTLGGKVRKIDDDDLKVFARNIDVLKDRYKSGITPQQIIDWSLPEDRERANKEIPLCAPFSRKEGIQRFMTNASKGSPVVNHYVTVEFLNFNDLVTQPRKVGLKLSREQLAKGAVKFDCDCGRHTFWFRYLATIGKYAHGRQENGFPKIRNPNLQGVACKHVLRVMQFITSPLGVQYIQNQVNKDRQAQLGQTIKQTNAQLKEQLTQQAKTAHHQRSNKVQTTEDRPAYKRKMAQEFAKEQQRRQQQEMMAMAKAQQKAEALAELESMKANMSQRIYDMALKGIEEEYK